MNKKLGLLLIPFIPLTAIGIVEVANQIVPTHETVAAHQVRPVVEKVPALPAPPPTTPPSAPSVPTAPVSL